MNFLTLKTAINGGSKKSSNLRKQLFTTRDSRQRKHALFRRVSPCVRFVAKRRESTRRNLSRRVGRFSRFMRVKIFSNIRSKKALTQMFEYVILNIHSTKKRSFLMDTVRQISLRHCVTIFAMEVRYCRLRAAMYRSCARRPMPY